MTESLAPAGVASDHVQGNRRGDSRLGAAGTDETRFQEVFRRIHESKIDYVRCQFVDFIGVGRGRTVRREYLSQVMGKGLPFAQVNNTVDIDDMESDFAYGSQAGDFWAVPDPASFTVLPYATATGHMFVDLVGKDGTPWPTCQRTALRRLSEAVNQEIGTARLGFEQEGYLLHNESGRYVPVHQGKQFTSELLDAEDRFLSDLGMALVTMGIPLEKMTAEGGLGMYEVNFGAAEPVLAADQYFRFKQAFRAVARQHGHIGSFMPKPFAQGTGAGLHVHISLMNDETGQDVLGDPTDPLGLSPLGRHFVGGLLAHAPAIVAFGSPSVNSYKRLQPGTWSPTHATFGLGNRSVMVRIVENRTDSRVRPVQRLEIRSPDGTCNPYALGSVLLAAGLDGVRRHLDPGSPMEADVSRLNAEELNARAARPLPRTLDRALDELAADDVIHNFIGRQIIDAFLNAKRIEWEKFASSITDWEYRYYAEFY